MFRARVWELFIAQMIFREGIRKIARETVFGIGVGWCKNLMASCTSGVFVLVVVVFMLKCCNR